jgi:hypothetical protein
VTKQLVAAGQGVRDPRRGSGTPTHTKVVDYLNASRVPDIFVSLGCLCWDDPQKHPYTFGWQPDYLVEGKILGQYIAENYKGKKVAYFLQNDDFGADGARAWTCTCPRPDVVTRQTYEPGNTDIGPQMAKIKASGADVIADVHDPGLHGARSRSRTSSSTTTRSSSSPTSARTPTTLTGLLKAFSKGKAGGELIDGIVSDTYLPPLSDTSNSWISLFKQIHDQYIPKLPFDGNVGYGLRWPTRSSTRCHARARTRPRRGWSTRSRRRLTGPGSSRSATRPTRTPASPARRSARSRTARSSSRASR